MMFLKSFLFPCLRFSSAESPVHPNPKLSSASLFVLTLLGGAMVCSATSAFAQTLSFGSINVCPAGTTTPAPCSKTLSTTFNIAAGTTIGSVHYLTLGAQNLDFKAKANDTSATLCTAKTYSAATTCTVDVTFAPLFPGIRNGAVELLDGSGNLIASNYVHGIGTSSEIAYFQYPGNAATELPGTFSNAQGVAVDGSGDVYVWGFLGNTSGYVQEMLAVNGSIPADPTIISILSGNYTPRQIAIDGAGNVYVADSGNDAIKEVLAVNGSVPANPVIRTIVATSFSLSSVAVDGSGDVFFSDSNGIQEVQAVNGSIPADPTINVLTNTTGGLLALDASGNLFAGGGPVSELLAVNGTIPPNPTIKTVISTVFNNPNLALDAANNIYLSSEEYLAVNGSIPANPTINYNLLGGGGLAIDASGNLFSAGASNVYEYPRSQPPVINMGSLLVDYPYQQEPVVVQIQNIGNSTLTVSDLTFG